jgi:hypothetical protein
LLVHYDNLLADLEGQMRRLAGQLGIAVPDSAWPALVRAATFESMRGNADKLVPAAGIFKSNATSRCAWTAVRTGTMNRSQT